MKKKVDVYQVLTNQIIEALEAGDIPWEKPWDGVNNAPKNFVSDRPYQGFNAMLTAFVGMNKGYKTNCYVSYKQAIDLGGQVKKGEKGVPITFWKMLKVKEEGEEKDIPILRYSTVFNLDQCEGIELPEIEVIEKREHETKEKIDLKVMEYLLSGPSVTEKLGNQAFYVPSTDQVVLPELGQFKTLEGYYATLFHELGHSTGHEKRLNRAELMKTDIFDNSSYAKEELIAELTACFCLSQFGLVNRTIENHKAYIKGWLKALKSNPKWIIEASSKARKASELILGIGGQNEDN